MRQVKEAAERLIEEGYMLAEDLEVVVESAESKYDFFTGKSNGA